MISGKSSLLSAIGLMIGSTVLVGQQVERFVVDQADQFDAIVDKAAKVELIADGFRFTEGPVWLAEEGGYLVFSDIPADRLYRWDSRNGVTVFREPSANTNGNLLDLQGRILSC